MKKKELSGKTIAELRSIAKSMGLKISRTSKKEDIITEILKAEKHARVKMKKPVKKVQEKKVIKKPSEVIPQTLKIREIKEEKGMAVKLHPLKDIMGIIPVNERMLYIYWELRDETMEGYRKIYPKARFVVRLYDITEIDDIEKAPFTDIVIYNKSGGIHIDTGRSGRFFGELGLLTVEGKFLKIIQSNVTALPYIKEIPEIQEMLPSLKKMALPSSR